MSTSYTPSGNQEQDWVNLLMASPLFKQINDLEQMLNKSAVPPVLMPQPRTLCKVSILFIYSCVCFFLSWYVYLHT